jgi:DNA-binding NtrC family response regulator
MTNSAVPRVLLVNDDADGMFLFRHAVAREFPNAVFFECRDGMAALTLLRSQQVDGFITDHHMVEMSGLALVAAIRNFDPETPIFMVTAAGNIERAARTEGVTEFNANGNWDEIRGIIRRILQ